MGTRKESKFSKEIEVYPKIGFNAQCINGHFFFDNEH
jgi:hypothetical protein